jgi:hypothetical protein
MDALVTANRVAASLAPEDTLSGLHDLERLAPRIGLAEIRRGRASGARASARRHHAGHRHGHGQLRNVPPPLVPGAELHVSMSTTDAGASALAALLTEAIPFSIV